MESEINLIIVDDHDIFRDGLNSLITHKKIANIIGEASNGLDFLKLLEHKKPDLVLMDISMPVMDGIEATQKALEKYPELNILVLSMFGDEEYYYKMINAGAKGFVLKSSGKNELEQAIKTVASGESYFSNELLRRIIANLSDKKVSKPKQAEKEVISHREFDVLQLMCSGLAANEIAEQLFISKKTVEGHRTKLFAKTGTKNSLGLVVYAIKNKIVEI